MLPLLKGKCDHILFGILLHGRFVFPALFINIANHLFMSVWTHGYLFYFLDYNPILSSFILLLRLLQLQPWALIQVSFCILSTYSHPFFSTSFPSDAKKCSGRTFYFKLPQPWINHFPKESEFLLLQNDIQKPESRQYVCLCSCWGIIISGCSKQTELGNICMYHHYTKSQKLKLSEMSPIFYYLVKCIISINFKDILRRLVACFRDKFSLQDAINQGIESKHKHFVLFFLIKVFGVIIVSKIT